MTDIQKIKISISILISLGIAEKQKDVGVLLGYKEDGSAFSQIINEKVPIPKEFIKKLRSLDKQVDDFWRFGFASGISTTSIPEEVKKEIEYLKKSIDDKEEIIKFLKEKLQMKSGNEKDSTKPPVRNK